MQSTLPAKTPIGPPRKRRVELSDLVQVEDTYAPSEYDRSPIATEPLTEEDCQEFVSFRQEMLENTLELAFWKMHFQPIIPSS